MGECRVCAQPASPAVANNVNHNILLVLCSPVSSKAAGSHHSFRIVCIHMQDGRPAPSAQTDNTHESKAPHTMYNVSDAFYVGTVVACCACQLMAYCAFATYSAGLASRAQCESSHHQRTSVQGAYAVWRLLASWTAVHNNTNQEPRVDINFSARVPCVSSNHHDSQCRKQYGTQPSEITHAMYFLHDCIVNMSKTQA